MSPAGGRSGNRSFFEWERLGRAPGFEGDKIGQVVERGEIEFLPGGDVFHRTTAGSRGSFPQLGPQADDKQVLRAGRLFIHKRILRIKRPESVQKQSPEGEIFGTLEIQVGKGGSKVNFSQAQPGWPARPAPAHNGPGPFREKNGKAGDRAGRCVPVPVSDDRHNREHL